MKVEMTYMEAMSTKKAHGRYPEDVESCTSSFRCTQCGKRNWIDACHDADRFLLVACHHCTLVKLNTTLLLAHIKLAQLEEA
jgi:hypothetical protein